MSQPARVCVSCRVFQQCVLHKDGLYYCTVCLLHHHGALLPPTQEVKEKLHPGYLRTQWQAPPKEEDIRAYYEYKNGDTKPIPMTEKDTIKVELSKEETLARNLEEIDIKRREKRVSKALTNKWKNADIKIASSPPKPASPTQRVRERFNSEGEWDPVVEFNRAPLDEQD